MKNKKGVESLTGTVMFIILNVMFFGLLFIFVARAGTGASIDEQTYAKKIALIIDSTKPGTEILIDVSKALEIAEKNNFDRNNIFAIDEVNKKIIVKLTKGDGYSFEYFNNNKILRPLVLPDDKQLKIQVVEKENEK